MLWATRNHGASKKTFLTLSSYSDSSGIVADSQGTPHKKLPLKRKEGQGPVYRGNASDGGEKMSLIEGYSIPKRRLILEERNLTRRPRENHPGGTESGKFLN